MASIRDNVISVPEKVDVELKDDILFAKGAKGDNSLSLLSCIDISIKDGKVRLSLKEDRKEDKKFLGLYCALVANLLKGVAVGFTRELIFQGVAYGATIKDKKLHLKLGFSHVIIVDIPQSLEVTCHDKGKRVAISGVDNREVGQFAADIRHYRPPEPYKGHGVYLQKDGVKERIRRKDGKKGKK